MKIRHILGISGGKDSAALSIYLKRKYPNLKIEYYNSDTGCELAETELLIDRLGAYLGHITRLRAAEGSPEPTPFEHFLKSMGGFLPSPQARWCTKKMKLDEFERFVGDDMAISYVGIRGDEDRDGYISSKPNIQSIFPFRRNIWSLDVVNKFLHNENLSQITEIYDHLCPDGFIKEDLMEVVRRPITKQFYYSKKLNALLDFDVKMFNHAVFEFLHTTDYPVGKLTEDELSFHFLTMKILLSRLMSLGCFAKVVLECRNTTRRYLLKLTEKRELIAAVVVAVTSASISRR